MPYRDPAKQREAQDRWRRKNLQKHAKWSKEHPEVMREAQRRYRAKNLKRLQEKDRRRGSKTARQRVETLKARLSDLPQFLPPTPDF